MEEYLIKRLKVLDKYYLYDGKTNYLCEIPEEISGKINKESFEDEGGLFKDFQQAGIYLPVQLETSVSDAETVAAAVNEYFHMVLPRKLVLEITEDCNLRCSYCPNTTGFSSRIHRNRILSFENACEAIDHYFELYIEVFDRIPPEKKQEYLLINVPNLNWWGGEPFLNFKLIKSTHEYFLSLPWHEHGISKNLLAFSVASNMTIFNEEIAEFLVRNRVYLMASCDGGQEEHDLYRKDKKGNGTFCIVNKNIDFLLNNHPQYARDRIMIQAVYMKGHSLLSEGTSFLRKKFRDSGTERNVLSVIQYPQKTETSMVSEEWLRMLPSISDRICQFNGLLDEMEKMQRQELSEYLRSNRIVRDEIKDVLIIEGKMEQTDINSKLKLNRLASCPIGRDVIFMSASGNYCICNKSNLSKDVGNGRTGILIDKVTDLLIEYNKSLSATCKKCWAVRFCRICPAVLLGNDGFRIPEHKDCFFLKETVLWNLSKYILLCNHSRLFEQVKSELDKIYKAGFESYYKPIEIK